ncbi:hypothetical protein [Cedecea sp.]|jgi:hypothetical protein|uniref:hypothetical protein n=1 Tax=Cedecea sp. TaxID=1970739 RepID=UPI0012AD9DBD|nr:hypothetical protein [Enterobacteriaceae bacterium RIT693]
MGLGLISSFGFQAGMEAIQAQMQKDALIKAKHDADNAKINGIADSAVKAGSAAAQIKVRY